jgi:osmotically-inducible protein OsmY
MTSYSDDEMRARILDVIDSTRSVYPGDVEVHVNAGVVTLSGRVSSYQTLLDVERLVIAIPGVRGLQTYIQSDIGNLTDRRSTVKERRCKVGERRC